METEIKTIGIRRVMELLPHRYPFLLVDRVEEYVPGSHILAYKNVTINEPFFQGHFPDLPLMPGVLVLEALAQTGGVYVLESPDLDIAGKVFVFSGMDKVRFRRPVVPGDKLALHVDNIKHKMTMWRMHGVARVNGDVAAEGTFTGNLVPREIL